MTEIKPLKNKIEEWLLKQGYPLEMRVAKSLRNKQFQVSQSHYYKDFQTGEHREIDILAKRADRIGLVEIAFLVECKTTKKPWVLFTSEDTIDGYNRLFALGITSEKAKEALTNDRAEKLFSLSSFKKEGRVAYGTTIAFTSGHDTAFKAAMSASKAALGRQSELKNERGSLVPFHFSFPIIVVDGPIFECYLENEEMVVQELSDSYLFFSNHHEKEPPTCIRVVKSNMLEAFCHEAAQLTETLLEFLEPEIEKEWGKMRNHSIQMTRMDAGA